jgi:hypothetical protein
MDGETIRLIVVACGTIVAGLAGALIAGAFNSRNTLATIEAARLAAQEQRDADIEAEHPRWLRDRKVELYTELVGAAYTVRNALGEIKVGVRKEALSLIDMTKVVFGLSYTVRVLSPGLVNQAVRDVMAALQDTTAAMHLVLEEKPEGQEAYDSAVGDFRDAVTLMELRMTADLGIDWAA